MHDQALILHCFLKVMCDVRTTDDLDPLLYSADPPELVAAKAATTEDKAQIGFLYAIRLAR
jgi:hypothetical protein